MKQPINSSKVLILAAYVVMLGAFLTSTTFGQSGPINGGTPDAMSFNAIRGDADGSYTGALQLNLPVLTIPGRNGLNYNVYLNYQSGMPCDLSSGTTLTPVSARSWTGTGFNIQIGRVTRTVLGRPDEQSSGWFNPNGSPYGNTFYLQNTPDGTDLMDGIRQYQTYNEFWDAYYLHLPDGSSRILPNDHANTDQNDPRRYYNFTAQDYKAWDIAYNTTAGGTYGMYNTSAWEDVYDNFRVIKEDGTLYMFGHKSDLTIANNVSPNTNGCVYMKYPVSWELSEIRSSDYYDVAPVGLDDNDQGSWIKFSYTPTQTVDLGYEQVIQLGYSSTYGHKAGARNAALNYDISYISTIETPTHIAEFHTSALYANDPRQRLDSIILRRKSDQAIIRQINFSYTANSEYIASVQEFGDNAQIQKPAMRFEFYPYMNQGADNLGYFGNSYSLKKITYPEGGSVEYQYEPNTYNWFFNVDGTQYTSSRRTIYNSTATTTGGARLKQVNVTDAMGTTKIWNYNYGEGFRENIPIGTKYGITQNFTSRMGSFVGYRWVQKVFPDNGGSITQYYTSGVNPYCYIVSGAPTSLEMREVQADSAEPLTRKIYNRVPNRGKIWKTVYKDPSGNEVSREETYNEYVGAGGVSCNLYVEGGYFTKKDSMAVIRDNIRHTTFFDEYDFYYTYTPRSISEKGSSQPDPDGYEFRRYRTKTNNKAVWGGPGSMTMYYRHMFSQIQDDHVFDVYDDRSWIDDGNLVSYSSAYWKPIPCYDNPSAFWNYRIYPFQKFLKVNFSDYTNELLTVQDSIQYDKYGNIIGSKDAKGIPNAAVYGMKGMVQIGKVSNALYNQVAIVNFDDGDLSAWTSGGGTWSNPSGVYQQTDGSTWPSWYDPRRMDNIQLDDANLEADVRFDNAGSYRYTALMKYLNSSSYIRFELRKSENCVRIHAQLNGAAHTQDASFSFQENRWYHVRGEINGQTAKLYIDGKLYITFTDAYVDQGLGKFGLCTFGTVASFDNVRFYPAGAHAVSMSYDPSHLKVSCLMDENGSKTYYQYDAWARLTQLSDGSGNILKKYYYSYSRAGNISDVFDASKPNYIREVTFRSAYDSTVTCHYYDGLGRKIQDQTFDGTGDLISSQSYDAFGEVTKVYKPYRVELGANAHKYDPNYAANSDAYYNSNWDSATNGFPYNELQFDQSPLHRLTLEGASGLVYRIGGGHEKTHLYGSNNSSDAIGYLAGQVYKETVADENGNATVKFTDQLGFVDAIKTSVGTTTFQYDAEGRIKQSTDPRGLTTNYYYGRLLKVVKKVSPDAGTVNYLYDMNGNLRFTQDANHTGAANNVYVSRSISSPSVQTAAFALTKPGNVSLSAGVAEVDVENPAYVTLKIKKNGATLGSISTHEWSGASATLFLPAGTYDYEATMYGDYGGFYYSITASSGNEFIYNKYDAFNRVTEEGEYISNSASGNFTQVNADNAAFPQSSTLVTKKYFYDTPSTDALAAGQRNLMGRISYTESYTLGGLQIRTFYSYDDRGRVEWAAHYGLGYYDKKIYYTYDRQGNVIQKTNTGYGDGDMNTYNSYDHAGRLSTVLSYFDITADDPIQDASYEYFANGKSKRLQLGTAQGVDYRYNERDWLTSINHQNLNPSQDPGGDGANGIPVDKFGMVIGYNNVYHVGAAQGAQAQFNGNISWTMYNTSSLAFNGRAVVGNSFAYDNANRLTASNFGYWGDNSWMPTPAYDESYGYDASGNFTTLNRNLGNGSASNIAYTYQNGTNKLTAATGGTYQYDANGNVTQDTYRGIAYVIYDINNLPISVHKTDGSYQINCYDVNGNRIRKVESAGSDTYYTLGADGKTEVVSPNPYGSGCTYNLWGNDMIGQAKFDADNWLLLRSYYLKDHLGTIRVTVDQWGNVSGYDDYSPFGMQLDGRSYQSSADGRYKFTSKERDIATGYDYFGARYYDSRVGRWLAIDPLANKFPDIAPYCYSHNDPINRLDIDGRSDPRVVQQRVIAAVNSVNQALAPVVNTIQPAVNYVNRIASKLPDNLQRVGGWEAKAGIAIQVASVHTKIIPGVAIGAAITTGGGIVQATGSVLKAFQTGDAKDAVNAITDVALTLGGEAASKGYAAAKEANAIEAETQQVLTYCTNIFTETANFFERQSVEGNNNENKGTQSQQATGAPDSNGQNQNSASK